MEYLVGKRWHVGREVWRRLRRTCTEVGIGKRNRFDFFFSIICLFKGVVGPLYLHKFEKDDVERYVGSGDHPIVARLFYFVFLLPLIYYQNINFPTKFYYLSLSVDVSNIIFFYAAFLSFFSFPHVFHFILLPSFILFLLFF